MTSTIGMSQTIPELREPGAVLTLPGTGELLQLEQTIGAVIIQGVARAGNWSEYFANEFMDNWKARHSLPEILKGEEFHGRLLGIELVAMDDPIGQLVASEKKRSGLSAMGSSSVFGSVNETKLHKANTYGYGFHVRAQRHSSSRHIQLEPAIADLWYAPKSSKPATAQLGGIMQRMVRTSAWNDEDFTAHVAKKSTPKPRYDELTLPR